MFKDFRIAALVGAALCCSVGAFASSPQAFTYQGRLLNAAGTGPLTEVVDITFGIYDKDGNCQLYQEKQDSIDLSSTAGVFSVRVGSAVGDAKRVAGVDPGNSMAKIFTNSGSIPTGSGTCGGNYSPVGGESRKLRVTVYSHSTLLSTVLSPDNRSMRFR